jgi:hypothetical protein
VFAEVFARGVPWEIDRNGYRHGHGHDHDHGLGWAHVHDEEPEHGTDAGVPVLARGGRNPGGLGHHPAGGGADGRTTAEIHDAVHERRRRAV